MKSSVIWLFIQNGGKQFFSLAVFFIIGRLLNPSELGGVVIAASVTQIFYTILMMKNLKLHTDLDNSRYQLLFLVCAQAKIRERYLFC